MLKGEHVLGVGEASRMFPIDSRTCDWDATRIAKFERLIAPRKLGITLLGVLPRVHVAGQAAVKLTPLGAKRLDSSGQLSRGIPMCPPGNDAGTGMGATNAVRPRPGNVSACTSVFAMFVLELPLKHVHENFNEGRPLIVHKEGSS